MTTSQPPVSNDTRERMSLAYVRLIAARHTCFVTAEEGGDMGSIDAMFQSTLQPRRCFQMQLKATSTPLSVKSGEVAFDLPLKNYDDLRRKDVTVPALLVVMQLPTLADEWLTVDGASTVVRRCVWWTDLWGAPATSNDTTIRVKIPETQIFSNEALTKIMSAMDQIAAGAQRKPLHEY